MKKKIALLLALIMTISLMPVSVFAASSNSVVRSTNVRSHSSKTLFVFDDGAWPGFAENPDFTRDGNENFRSFAHNRADRVTVNVDNATDAHILELDFSDTSGTGDTGEQFELSLTNAAWVTSIVKDIYNDDRDQVPTNRNVNTNNFDINSTNVQYGFDLTHAFGGHGNVLSGGATGFNMDNWLSFTYDPTVPGTNTNKYGEIGYRFTVDSLDPERAIITINNDYGDINAVGHNNVLRIPLFLTTTDTDVTVEVINMNSLVSEGVYAISVASAGGTTNSVRTERTGTSRIALDTIIFRENSSGAIKNGIFELIAPSGYMFNNVTNWRFSVTGGLTYRGAANERFDDTDIAYYDSSYSSSNNRSTNERFMIAISGLDGNRRSSGSLLIDGVELIPLDDRVSQNERELQMRIVTDDDRMTEHPADLTGAVYTDLDGDKVVRGSAETDITAELLTVAKIVQTGIKFEAISDAPDLIIGRWDARTNRDTHKAAEVSFREVEVGAWNAPGVTRFTLPEGVNIRGIDFTSTSNVEFAANGDSLLLDSHERRATSSDLNLRALENQLEATRFVDERVTYYGNEFTLDRLSVETNEMANVSFVLYLSISPDFTGDEITLSVSGSGIPTGVELDPIVIANAIRPIEIETTTTSVQIGFQNYSVADITIKENVAGALVGGESLFIDMTDSFGINDMPFMGINSSQVTLKEGNIRVTPVNNLSGSIQLRVDSESTVASTIVLSDLVIRITRNVPYGKYDLVAYGWAVFQNYAYIPMDNGNPRIAVAVNTDGTNELPGLPTVNDSGRFNKSLLTAFGLENQGFKFPGYVSVDTVGEGVTTAFTNKVTFRIDSTTITVDGGDNVEMDVLPFNSNGTLMVPLRFLAQAFGVTEDNIFWDDTTGTASVISNGRTVSITRGSSTMVINGIPNTMLDEQGRAVTPANVNGRIFIPIRQFVRAFGISNDAIQWNSATNEAVIDPTV